MYKDMASKCYYASLRFTTCAAKRKKNAHSLIIRPYIVVK